jgi:hypothetical protein
MDQADHERQRRDEAAEPCGSALAPEHGTYRGTLTQVLTRVLAGFIYVPTIKGDSIARKPSR